MPSVLTDIWIQFGILFAARGAARIIFPTPGTRRLIIDCVFFAALTALLLLNNIPPYSSEDVDLGVTRRLIHGVLKTLWWLAGAMVLANCARVFLILEHKPREGRLLQDLVVAIIYVSAALCVIAYVFSLPVGTIIATSGVFAIVLGLALQSTLNDVFSGIALNLNRLLSVGDWVVLDHDVQGKVVETNWRSTQFLNKTGDLVVVPNSILAKSRITNLSVPDMSHGASLTIKMQANGQPKAIADTMHQVLLSSSEILRTPSPSVSILGLSRDCVEVELSFRVPTVLSVGKARNEIFDLIYRHTMAAGLPLASDPPGEQQERSAGATNIVRRLVDMAPIFANLSDDEKNALVAAAERLVLKQGAVIAKKNTATTSLMILARGVAIVEEDTEEGKIEFARLAPGDLLGERGVLLGGLEVADTKCLTDVVLYQIGKAKIAGLLRERPAIAEDLAALLSLRTKAEEAIQHAGRDQTSKNLPDLRMRILRLFHL
ncbi:mechanosensitive ion channel domain-containing protein [Rhizobium leguminosarum]|uniref:Small-conductance mechanosensitive channel n=1 Tax=Rhizobium leguminosarum TaxID=384 RepID=A0A7K3VKC0_RHILE|nr:mechanosensitive ion channel family protein [Rhizobium leguminosarum]NEK17650.1 mechanosensitive ion channel [Rhizobium leguminosarum]